MSRPALSASAEPLTARYDVALLDLDGVVYLGAEVVPGAAPALEKAAAAGLRRAYVTNNASRTPEQVADLLRGMDVPAEPEQVITSSQAAAHVLADRLPAGAPVLVVGAAALAREVEARGLTVVDSADASPAAVVQGFSPDLGWKLLAEAAVAVRRGALWVATNTDSTVPSPRGPLPGNGSLVGVVKVATGAEPLVTGKPEPALHRESVERSGAHRPLIVGDRLDTDIEGANRAGADSLLVFTGVTAPADLLAAVELHRPTYLSAGLDGLLVPHPAPEQDGDAWTCGGYRAAASGDGLQLSGTGDEHDALRALCAAAWSADRTGPVTAEGDDAEAALHRLGLTG